MVQKNKWQKEIQPNRSQADAEAKEPHENPSREPSQAAKHLIRLWEQGKELHFELMVRFSMDNAMQMVQDAC